MMDERAKRLVLMAIVGVFFVFVLIWSALGRMEGFWISGDALGTWLAAFLTLSILTFLYDDNPFYRFAESLFIGISAGYVMVQGVWQMLIPNLLGKIAPQFVGGNLTGTVVETNAMDQVVAWGQLVLGCMLLWRLAPRGAWISRWPLAIIVGWAAGANLARFLVSDFTKQIGPTIIPLVETSETGVWGIDWLGTLTACVSVFGVLTTLVYFFFSVEHKGVVGRVSRAGIWILMLTFGAAFGYTVMGRVALLIGRMEFLIVDWLRLVSQ